MKPLDKLFSAIVIISTIIFLTIGLALPSCSAVNTYFGLSDDNPAEEILEQIIKSKTGADIDLTPETPEFNVFLTL